MLTMKQLLAVHDRSRHPLALEDCLGDGYLLLHNPIYAAIRSRFVNVGGNFVSDDSPLCADYRIAPLFCLRQIIEQRTVPYHQNAAVCRRLVTLNPDMKISGPYLMQSFKKNLVLHESAHCIGYLAPMGVFEQRGMSEKEEFVRRSIISEAFANAAERIGWALNTTSTESLIFGLNTTFAFDPPIQERIRTMIARWGVPLIFRAAFYTFYFYNTTLHDVPAPASELLEAVGPDLSLSKEETWDFEEMIRTCFTLNIGFRQNTSPSFFRFYESESEFIDVCNGADEGRQWRQMDPKTVGWLAEIFDRERQAA